MLERLSSRPSSIVLIVFVLVWGLITHGTSAGSGDEPHYMMIAHSLAFDGDLDLTNDYQDPLVNTGHLQPELHARPREGRLRPVHDIGMPLLFAPVLRIAYPAAQWLGTHLPPSIIRAGRLNTPLILRHLMSLAMALLTGLLARELFVVLLAIGATPRAAFGWSVLFALSPPILSHSFLFFTEITSAFITFAVYRRLVVHPVRSAAASSLVGVPGGFLLLVHARNVGIVAGLVLVAVLAVRAGVLTRGKLAAFMFGLGASVVLRSAITYVLWASYITTPHAALGPATGLTSLMVEIFVRASGLLFDREFGLLAYGPVYAIAAAGFFLMFRRNEASATRRFVAVSSVIVSVSYLVPVLLPFTNVHGWTGGWTPAARFLVPVAAFFWMAVCATSIRANTVGRWVIGAFVTWQIAIDVFVWQHPKTLWNDGDGITAFNAAAWLPSWTNGKALPFVVASMVLLALAVTLTSSGTRAAASRVVSHTRV